MDKMLYTDKKICEYELYEKFEIIDGIKQYLDDEFKEKIYDLSKRNFDINQEIYINIFRIANKEIIKSNKEAKKIVDKIARQIVKQKGLEIER